MQQERTTNKALVAVIIIVLLAAATAGVIYLTNEQGDSSGEDVTTTSRDESTKDTAGSSTTDSNTDAAYKAGSYTATGSYSSPGGTESIEVSVTMDTQGEITATSATSGARNSTSRQYQSEFINNYKDLVIGKNVEEVSLSRVAGSSLTSGGFNEALEQIKQDATA